MNPFMHKNVTNGNMEFFQPYSIAATDALNEMSTDMLPAVLSFSEHLLQTHTSWVKKFCFCS
jgi:hypothetical protein